MCAGGVAAADFVHEVVVVEVANELGHPPTNSSLPIHANAARCSYPVVPRFAVLALIPGVPSGSGLGSRHAHQPRGLTATLLRRCAAGTPECGLREEESGSEHLFAQAEVDHVLPTVGPHGPDRATERGDAFETGVGAQLDCCSCVAVGVAIQLTKEVESFRPPVAANWLAA